MDSNRTQAGSSIRAAGDLTVKSDMRPNRCTRKQIQRSRVFYEMRRKFDASARCTAEERAPWKMPTPTGVISENQKPAPKVANSDLYALWPRAIRGLVNALIS